MSQSRRITRLHPIRILIVDRHRAVRKGLASRLGAEADLVIVGQAADGPAAIALVKRLQPEVVLIEASLLRGDGSETTRRLRAAAPASRILAMDIGADPNVVAAVRAAGVTGFVDTLKPIGGMLATIRQVHDAGQAPWMTACRNCGWTSGDRQKQRAAEIIGRVHEQDHLGHTVVLKEVPVGARTPKKAGGKKSETQARTASLRPVTPRLPRCARPITDRT
jgi:CheY-like chemotaxis protein